MDDGDAELTCRNEGLIGHANAAGLLAARQRRRQRNKKAPPPPAQGDRTGSDKKEKQDGDHDGIGLQFPEKIRKVRLEGVRGLTVALAVGRPQEVVFIGHKGNEHPQAPTVRRRSRHHIQRGLEPATISGGHSGNAGFRSTSPLIARPDRD